MKYAKRTLPDLLIVVVSVVELKDAKRTLQNLMVVDSVRVRQRSSLKNRPHVHPNPKSIIRRVEPARVCLCFWHPASPYHLMALITFLSLLANGFRVPSLLGVLSYTGGQSLAPSNKVD